MRVVYDEVAGLGWRAPGVTDTYPDMLRMSRVRSDGSEGRLTWRKVRGGRFGPYWLGLDPRTWGSYRGWHNVPLRIGEPMVVKQVVNLIRHHKAALRRRGGTLLVQVRREDRWGGTIRVPGGAQGYIVSIGHTTQRMAEVTNPFLPDGFPSRLR